MIPFQSLHFPYCINVTTELWKVLQIETFHLVSHMTIIRTKKIYSTFSHVLGSSLNFNVERCLLYAGSQFPTFTKFHINRSNRFQGKCMWQVNRQADFECLNVNLSSVENVNIFRRGELGSAVDLTIVSESLVKRLHWPQENCCSSAVFTYVLTKICCKILKYMCISYPHFY